MSIYCSSPSPKTRNIGPTNLNAFQFGRSYGSSTAALSSPLKSTRPSSSYSNFGVCYGLTNSAVPRQPSLSGSTKILLENDRPPLIHRSSIDRSSTGATDYASPFSSISSGRYPSSTLSSRDSDSKIPLNNSTRLSCTTESCKKGQKENEERQEGILDRYVIVISRGCSTEEVLGLNHKLTGISATKTETMEQSLGKKSSFTNSTQTSDDILLPLAKNSVNSPSGSKIGTPRRLNIGGRYLNHLHRQDSTEPQSPQPSRGGWRESVYGVDYAAKSRAQTQPPTSPQPQQGLSLAEQRKLERERMLEEEWKNQLQLEIEREKRRLRQLERKARWEKDEAKNRELEEEIKRRRQAAAELAERESNLRRGEDQRMRESRPSPSQITTQIGFSQDPIQKVNDWKRQNSLRDADPPSAGEMNSSQLWNISDERNETPLVHLRGNASSRSPFPRKSEASRFSRDSETTIRQDTLTSEHKVSGEMPSTRRRSSAALSGSYAMQHTDIDDLLKDKFPTREPPVTNCKGNLVKSSSLRRDYYVDDSGDSEEENLKLIFKSWKSKDIFQRMSTEVQNLLLKSHKRLINVRMLMEVCRNKYHDRRFTDAEEKNFKGYKTGNEFLTESGIDVKKLEESALQLCRFGQAQSEFGSYLDLDSTLQEQWEELEISQDQENSIVLRTKLVVRVKAIIEKLFNSTGRELRRALFSLKQIFQDDKDLVHEFVTNAGLDCLVSVGSRSDQNLQNYILRALGQIMLYVDGMAGVVEHPETLRWLYCLLTSKFRLVTKTALKLLLVFVEYADTNALVFVKAVHTYHANSPSSGRPWSHIISILNNEADGSELPIYAMTLVNRTLNAIPDQDTFYDVTDSLEEMGMQQLVQAHIHKKNCDPELVEQFQLYEAGLRYEDGEDYDFEVLPAGSKECLRQRKRTTRSQLLGTPDGLTLLSSMNTLPTSPSLALEMDGSLARKSKRYQSVENLNLNKRAFQPQIDRTVNNVSPWSRVAESGLDEAPKTADFRSSTDEEIRGKAVTVPETPPVGSLKSKIEALGKASQRPPMETSPTHAPVSPSGGVKALKEMHAAIMEKPEDSVKAPPPRERTGMIMSAKERFEASFSSKPPSAPAPASPARKDTKNGLSTGITVVTSDAESNVDVFWERCLDRVRRKPLRLRDYDFTDLEPEDQEEPRPLSSHYPRIGVPVLPSPAPIGGAIPPPVPSAIVGGIPPPPPPSTRGNALPPPPYGLSSAGPPPPPPSLGTTSSPGTQLNLPPVPGTDLPKTKKTVKLHWTEWKPSPKDLKCIANAKQTTAGRDKLDSAVDSKGIGGRFFSSVMSRSREPKEAPKDWKKCTIWSEVVQVKLDADFLQECFENKSAEVKVKKQDVGTKKIEVLDVKRSNAINIGLKVLPPPRTISTAILKMDSSIINREGIEKLLTSMLPTEEECEAILKAKAEQNGLPLGQAEQFLITLSEITYLKPRLELWLFKLDYEFIEKEIADPLADLKQGVNEVINCKTLRYVISTLLTIGNFLNGTNFRGFTLDYLARLPEVKDTKYKNSLLYHICCIVLDQFPDSTDIHSDMGAICRCHRIDWEELPEKLNKLEHDSKQAWDHYRLIFSSEKEKQKNAKLYEFLTDSMERIICLQLVYRRLMARFRHMLEYVGYSPGRASSMSVGHFCRILAEFALEYRTTREKIIEGRDKKAKARERKRTTGKLIIDVTGLRGTPNLSSQAKDDEALRGLLSKPNGETDSDASSLLGTLNRRRGNTPARRSVNRARSPSQLGEASDASMEALYPEQELLLDACWRNPSSDSLSIGSPSTPGRRQPPRERRRPAVRERHSMFRS